jgi:hypothetical protein
MSANAPAVIRKAAQHARERGVLGAFSAMPTPAISTTSTRAAPADQGQRRQEDPQVLRQTTQRQDLSSFHLFRAPRERDENTISTIPKRRILRVGCPKRRVGVELHAWLARATSLLFFVRVQC